MSIYVQFLGRKLIMEKGFVDKVEDNAAVRIWAETTQREKGDSLTEGYVSELWDFTRISVIQNDLREMKEVWDQWDVEAKELFYCNYGDLPYLLSVKVDKYLFRALAQFWNPAYSCFTFGEVDLVLPWRSTLPYFVVPGFRVIGSILELLVSLPFGRN